MLKQDYELRTFLKEKLKRAGVARITIARSAGRVQVSIATSRPGVIIGRGGAGINELRKVAQERLGKDVAINIEVEEIATPELNASVVAQTIAEQLEKRIPHRRIMKQVIEAALTAGAKGVRVQIEGRIGGAEIARKEWLAKGKIPLHTLRAVIDYAEEAARTTYGAIGIKVWVYTGEVFVEKPKESQSETRRAEESLPPRAYAKRPPVRSDLH